MPRAKEAILALRLCLLSLAALRCCFVRRATITQINRIGRQINKCAKLFCSFAQLFSASSSRVALVYAALLALPLPSALRA